MLVFIHINKTAGSTVRYILRSTFGGDREANSADEPRMTYTIVRKSGGHSTELDVSESTQVDPNDVVKVEQDVGTREGGKIPNQQIPSD